MQQHLPIAHHRLRCNAPLKYRFGFLVIPNSTCSNIRITIETLNPCKKTSLDAGRVQSANPREVSMTVCCRDSVPWSSLMTSSCSCSVGTRNDISMCVYICIYAYDDIAMCVYMYICAYGRT